MKNAHERFGVLEYTKRMKDTTTRIRLRLDRFIAEVDNERNCKAHLISVLGGDSDVCAVPRRAAIWIARGARVGRVVQRGTQAAWDDQNAPRAGMLSRAR